MFREIRLHWSIFVRSSVNLPPSRCLNCIGRSRQIIREFSLSPARLRWSVPSNRPQNPVSLGRHSSSLFQSAVFCVQLCHSVKCSVSKCPLPKCHCVQAIQLSGPSSVFFPFAASTFQWFPASQFVRLHCPSAGSSS